jgi:hypothetical protein
MDTKAIAERVAHDVVAGNGTDVTKDRQFQHLAKRALSRDRAYRMFEIERIIVFAEPSGIRLAIHLAYHSGGSAGYVEAEYTLSNLSLPKT